MAVFLLNQEDITMQKHHFYASSVATWATTNDTRTLRDLISLMDSEKHSWSLWLVPGSWDTPYPIGCYAPQVAGAIELEFTQFRNGRRVKPAKAITLVTPKDLA
jgi:hypothetical protein